MEIEKRYNHETRIHKVIITFDDGYLLTKCESHPYKHLITDEQGYGIIEDAILLASGLQLKPKEPPHEQ